MENSIGYLRVRVYSSKKMFPIESARVEISTLENGVKRIIKNVLTDENGNTGDIPLSSTSKILSFASDTVPLPVKPYAVYMVKTEAEGYITDEDRKVSIFEGVVSIQSVELVLKDID